MEHSEITLDDFASTYSTSIFIKWDCDPAHILIETDVQKVIINPIYEDQIRQLKSWTVGDGFRQRFPEISQLIDQDTIPS